MSMHNKEKTSADRNLHIAAALFSVSMHALALLWLMHSGDNQQTARSSVGSGDRFTLVYIDSERPDDTPDNTTEERVTLPLQTDARRTPLAMAMAMEHPLQSAESTPGTHGDSATEPADQPSLSIAAMDTSALPTEGNAAQAAHAKAGEGIQTRYHAAIRARIEATWRLQSEAPFPDDCSLEMVLSPGGPLLSARTAECEIEPGIRQQLEAAALMAQPLPYAGFEFEFSENLTLPLREPVAKRGGE